MKYLKIAAAVVGALLALVTGLVVAAALLVDGDWLKERLAGTVQERTGRSLRITGDAALSLLPRPGLRVAGVSLSEPSGGREFASLDSARVSMALLPLLSGRLLVDRIEIDGLRATVIRRRDGGLNIDDLLGGTSGAGAARLPPVELAGISLANGRLTWLDERSGRNTVISGLELTTGPLALTAGSFRLDLPRLAAGVGRGTDRYRLQLTAPAIAGTGENLSIERLDLQLDVSTGQTELKARLGARLAYRPDRRLLAVDDLAGHLDIGHPRLPMKNLRLPLSGSLQADLAKPAIHGKLNSRLDDAAMALTLELSRLSPPALGFDLQIDRLDMDRYLPSLQGGSGGQADLEGPRGLDLDGTIRIGQLRFAGFESRSARLSVSLRDGRLEYSGLAGQAVKAGVDTVVRGRLGQGLASLLPVW